MKRTILLVDDDRPYLESLAALLKALGYTVLARSTAGDALAAWFDEPSFIDCVITDYMMRPRDGLELSFALRVLGCDKPVIMVTGRFELPDQKLLGRAGITVALEKADHRLAHKLDLILKSMLFDDPPVVVPATPAVDRVHAPVPSE
jgi:CheY-like chemotaxis protein